MKLGARSLFQLSIMALISVAAVGTAIAAAPSPVRVLPLVWDYRDGDVIGPKRAGSLCLPAGSVTWREARPDPDDAREAFTAGLREGGLSVGDPDNPFAESGTAADRAIKGHLRGLRLSACVPPSGMGRVLNHSHAIKGDGAIAVDWRVFERGQGEATASGVACVGFSYADGEGSLPRMVLAGIRAAGVRIGAAVAKGEQQRPEDDACRRLRPGAVTPGA